MVFKFFLNCIWNEWASVNPAGFSEWGQKNFSETVLLHWNFLLPMEINIGAFLMRVYPLQLDFLFSLGKKGVTEPMHSPLEEEEQGLSWPATPSLGVLGDPAQQVREGFRQEESASRWVEVFFPTVFQEVFVKVTEAAWSDSAPGFPPAQLQLVLQCLYQAPPSPSSTRAEGVAAMTVLHHSLWWLFYCKCSLPRPSSRDSPSHSRDVGCFTAGCLCVKMPPGSSVCLP